MSAHPANTMAALCVVGGVTGFVRTRSVPSIVAGVAVGSLYAWSAYRIRTGGSNGHEGALAASAVLFLSSLPRVAAGPVPLVLTVSSALAGAYYGKAVWDFR